MTKNTTSPPLFVSLDSQNVLNVDKKIDFFYVSMFDSVHSFDKNNQFNVCIWEFMNMSNVYTSLIPIDIHHLSSVLISGFQRSYGALKFSKAVHGKFHGSGGHNKGNSFQDRANFHISRAWNIFLIFKTAYY